MGRNRDYWDKRREFNSKAKDFRDKYFPKKQTKNYEGAGSGSKLSSKGIFLIILFVLFIGPFYLLYHILKFIFTHKPVLIMFFIAAAGIGGYYIVNNTFLKNPSPAIETAENITDNELTENEEIMTETVTSENNEANDIEQLADNKIKVKNSLEKILDMGKSIISRVKRAVDVLINE